MGRRVGDDPQQDGVMRPDQHGSEQDRRRHGADADCPLDEVGAEKHDGKQGDSDPGQVAEQVDAGNGHAALSARFMVDDIPMAGRGERSSSIISAYPRQTAYCRQNKLAWKLLSGPDKPPGIGEAHTSPQVVKTIIDAPVSQLSVQGFGAAPGRERSAGHRGVVGSDVRPLDDLLSATLHPLVARQDAPCQAVQRHGQPAAEPAVAATRRHRVTACRAWRKEPAWELS